MGKYILSLLTVFLLNEVQGQNHILTVGDKAPPLKVFEWVKGNSIKEFKKGEVYLVEFGATWCIPCAESIPELTALQKKYKNKVSVISVFVMELNREQSKAKKPAYVKHVEEYINKKRSEIEYNVAVDNPEQLMANSWVRAAGFTGIPCSFVIDKNGKIAWIGTPNPEVLTQVIEFVLLDTYNLNDAIQASGIQKSSELQRVDQDKPLFIDGNGGDGKDFMYRSILTKYKGERGGNSDVVYAGKWSKGRVQQIGVPLEKLYYMAYADTISYLVATRYVDGTDNFPDTIKYPTLRNSYGKYWYKAILEVSDSTSFHFLGYRSIENRYNYSLSIPIEKENANFLQAAMRRDLKTYFGYDVTVEERIMPCWKLIASAKAESILRTKTPGHKYDEKKNFEGSIVTYVYKNAIMKDILLWLLLPFSFGYADYGIRPLEEAPILDETGFNFGIDYSISNEEMEEILEKKNWNAALDFLHRLGLDLVKGERLTKVVVIRDLK